MKKLILLLSVAAFIMPLSILAQYSNASLNGPWINTSLNGVAYLIFDGNGNITELGTPDDSLHPVGTYSVTTPGAFTASLTLTSGVLADSGQMLTDSTFRSYNIATGPSLDLEVTNTAALEGTWSGRIYDSTTLGSRNIQFTVNNTGTITSATGITLIAGKIFEAQDTFAAYITATDSDCHLSNIQIGGLYIGGNTLEGLCQLGKDHGGNCNAGGNAYFARVASGIANVSPDIDFAVYPSPFTDQVEVTIKNPSDKMQLDLYDILGQKIYTKQLGSAININISNLSAFNSGVYFLRLTADNKTTTRRLVKE